MKCPFRFFFFFFFFFFGYPSFGGGERFSYKHTKEKDLAVSTQIWGILKLSCSPKKRPKRV